MFYIFSTTILLLLLCTTPAFSHDCWIQPDHFNMGLETLLFARLFVGHRLQTDKELPLEKALTPRLDLITTPKKINLLPLMAEGHTPIVDYRPTFQGPGLLVMDRDFTTITMANDKFSQYLVHERHEELLPLMEANTRSEQNERYARCVKALVGVGDVDGQIIHDHISGQNLEIVLRSDPRKLKPADPLTITVLFQGQPLAGKFVTAMVKAPNGQLVETVEKTDQNGAAVFKSPQPGMWLLRLVHLYPCEDIAGLDWESYWGAYCFEIAG